VKWNDEIAVLAIHGCLFNDSKDFFFLVYDSFPSKKKALAATA
jgi:hypothetical protein